MKKFKVTEKAMRPASNKKECFYCNSKIGRFHEDDCVLVKKKVKVVATIEYEIEVPADWTEDNVHFHRNEGSWCTDNMIGELEELSKDECLCFKVMFECEDSNGEPFLGEG